MKECVCLRQNDKRIKQLLCWQKYEKGKIEIIVYLIV